MTYRVLILDADQRSALATTRSLGSHGLVVLTADTSAHTLAGSSKFSNRSHTYPNPSQQPVEFVAAIADLAAQNAVDIVMPMTDLTTMLLAADRTRLAPARLSCADTHSYERLSDKSTLLELARELRIPAPETRVANQKHEVLLNAKEMDFPVVIKPARSKYLHEGRIHSTTVRIARTAGELQDIVSRADWMPHIPCLLQEFIPGHGAGLFALSRAGDTVAWFAHRRLREKPPSGGVSVLSESVPYAGDMQEYADRLLQAARWDGPAMIEFRIGPQGRPYLMEVNGRLWGSLQLSIDCGLDFPWLMVHLVRNEPLPSGPAYHLGSRLRWLMGDVDNLLLQLRNRQLPATAKLRAVARFAASSFDLRCRQEIFRWSDPSPGWHELRAWIRALA